MQVMTEMYLPLLLWCKIFLRVKSKLLILLQTVVEVEDYKKAKPDAIAHSAAKIIDRVKAACEKTVNAFKSLCWRCKGIQVEVKFFTVVVETS